MDIFKVLSRSTKLPSNRNSSKTSLTTEIPSAGKPANPQLYHDALPDLRGTKRKRTTALKPPVDGKKSESFSEVNYFAPAVSNVPNIQKGNSGYDTTQKESCMNESECRQVLRSHRIKIALLKSKIEKRSKSRKSKKKRDVKKIEKEEYKSIYPQPLIAISDLRDVYGLSNRLADNLERQGYKIPTEVQMACLPLLLRPEVAMRNSEDKLGESGLNLMAIAPTGSGKTLAFLIPIIDQIIQRRRQRDNKSFHIIEAVVIAPTKELADQIVNEAKILCQGTGVKVSGMRKGMRVVDSNYNTSQKASSHEDEDEKEDEDEDENEDDDEEEKEKSVSGLKAKAQKGCLQPITRADILVSTPGLLLNALSGSNATTRFCLNSVRTLVLDEADVLLEPLFREQTCSIWSALTFEQLRTTLWSATISSSIENLALSIIRKRSKKQSPLIRLVIGLKDSALSTISQTLTYCGSETGKLLALRNLLHTSGHRDTGVSKSLRPPIIVFTQTIPRAMALHAELLYDIPAQAGGSSRIAVLHSSLSAIVRSATLNRFRNGDVWVLITTDLLSRGVDFRGVNAVVNYDIPNDAASYIHRVGRTGRGGRKGGVAVTFYTREDVPFVRGIVNIIEASRKAGVDPNNSDSANGSTSWLLDVLPKLGKKEKKDLKLWGVEARRRQDNSHGKVSEMKVNTNKDVSSSISKTKLIKPSKNTANRISTKSGYERKLENRKRSAIEASKRKNTSL